MFSRDWHASGAFVRADSAAARTRRASSWRATAKAAPGSARISLLHTSPWSLHSLIRLLRPSSAPSAAAASQASQAASTPRSFPPSGASARQASALRSATAGSGNSAGNELWVFWLSAGRGCSVADGAAASPPAVGVCSARLRKVGERSCGGSSPVRLPGDSAAVVACDATPAAHETSAGRSPAAAWTPLATPTTTVNQ